MFGVKQMVSKKITILKWKINIGLVFWLTLGLISTSYLLITNIKRILAFNDTTKTWNISVGTSNTFTFDTNLVTVGGGGAQPIENVNKIVNPSFKNNVNSWKISAVEGVTTPKGWIVAPGNSTFNTADFLVMKYEAKCVNTSSPETGLTSPADTNYKVYRDDGATNSTNNCTGANGREIVSLASGYPITYINQSEANTRCGSVAMGVGATAHLMSSNEWMTVARNAEAQNSNWSLGEVGNGYFYAGHNDNSPAWALQASTNDINRAAFTNSSGETEALTLATNTSANYSGTTGDQVRTFNLSNNSVIWDIAGNVNEWNSDIQSTAVNTTAGWVEWDSANLATGARALYGPSNSNYLSGQGMGRVYGGSIGNAFIRGGHWNNTSHAGAFYLALSYSPSSRYFNIGFRCASDPVAIFQSYSSSIFREAAGANLVTVGPLTDAKITQVVNVGNTANYDFSVYVYNNKVNEIGATITSEIAQLYDQGGTILTTYTNVGGGWYKLSGTVAGTNTNREIGLLVKAGKTVVVDDFTLSKSGVYSIYTTNAYSNNNLNNWDSFTASVGTTTSLAGVKYQICADDGTVCEANIGTTGTTWEYWNESAWVVATNSNIDTNRAEVVNDNINKFGVVNKKISVKAIMNFGGENIPTIDSFTVGLTTDTTSPGNISTITMMKNVSAGTTMMANSWTNDLGPYFSWNEAVDNEGGVGIKGYCLYLSNGEGNPSLETETSPLLPGNTDLDSVHISSANTKCGNGSGFLVSTLNIDFNTQITPGSGGYKYRGATWLTTSATPYYLYVKAVDKAGNIASDPNVSFRFRIDNTPPANPSYISLPGDYVSTKTATFLWASGGVDGPKDEGQSGVAGLQYRIGVGGTWYGSNHTGSQGMDDLLVNNGNYTTLEEPDFASIAEGSNIIYLRTWDMAGNVTSSYVSSALKINTQSPSKPTNLEVGPTDSQTNLYSFTWDDPVSVTGQASKLTFCYSVNTLPTAISCSFTDAGVHELTADAFATQPGVNTFYLVARDESGNINYENYEKVTFKYSGSAPGIPRNVDVADISIKASSDWKLILSWGAPTSIGAGVANYKVYRSLEKTACSTEMLDYSLMGTTSGTSYSDVSLSQKNYYYCIKACDSANNCSAASTTVTKYPTGKYYTAANLTSEPTVSSITTKKAVIKWGTDRVSDSKVSYGTKSNNFFTEEPSNSSQVTDHTINLNNLSPGTTYYYKVKWTDGDGNTGTSEEKSFTTTEAPTVKDVEAKNVGLSGAIIQFTTKNASKVKIYYGTTTSFGGIKEISTSTAETIYTSEIIELTDGTKYYYKINTFDSDNSEYEGTTLDFTTLPRPKISSVRLEQVANTAQTTIRVSWNTNTETSSIVSYYPENNTADSRDEVKVALEKGSHSLIIRGLLPQTNYILLVKGRDKLGNEAISESQRFTTATDTRPPSIVDLKVLGGTIPPVGFAAGEVKAQLIITWNTDELATSQVEFGEGTGVSYGQKSQEDGNLTTNHTVILSNLTPSQVYHLRAISKDKAGNEAKSIDTVTIAPKATKSALDLVIKNLSEAFTFMNTIRLP